MVCNTEKNTTLQEWCVNKIYEEDIFQSVHERHKSKSMSLGDK